MLLTKFAATKYGQLRGIIAEVDSIRLSRRGELCEPDIIIATNQQLDYNIGW